MMVARILSFCLSVCVFAIPAIGQDVKLDKEKSKVDFVGKKKGGEHKGGFKSFKADAKVNWSSPEKSTLTIDIDTDSLWSDDDKLTGHLKNPDFFDVKKFPKIKFESTKIEHGENASTIFGKLTMLGKTVEVEVPTENEVSEEELVVEAKFKIDRTKWGMNYGKGMIDDEVEITALLVFKR